LAYATPDLGRNKKKIKFNFALNPQDIYYLGYKIKLKIEKIK